LKAILTAPDRPVKVVVILFPGSMIATRMRGGHQTEARCGPLRKQLEAREKLTEEERAMIVRKATNAR
jgi:hypothetical protein